MRVGIVAPPWLPVPPGAYGGTEVVLDTLAQGLVRSGHEVVLFTTGDSTSPVPKAWEYSRAVGVGAPGPVAEIRHVIAAYEALREVDVIHDHTLVGPIYGQLTSTVPAVTTNHGPFRSDLHSLYRAISSRVAVVAISHHQASTAPDVRIAAVIHHGLDVDRFVLGAGDGGYLAFLGRMHPDKGVHVAARVARAAGIPLLIAAKMSEPHEKDYFDSQVRPHLGGDVEYIGEVAGATKQAFLADAVGLLNPICWPEPFGMVMIEAGAYGTPVIATPFGAAPEIVVDGLSGYLRDGEEALVEAVSSAAKLDRAACRAVVVERFSAQKMVDAHLRLYGALLENQPSAERYSASASALGSFGYPTDGHRPGQALL